MKSQSTFYASSRSQARRLNRQRHKQSLRDYEDQPDVGLRPEAVIHLSELSISTMILVASDIACSNSPTK